GTARGLRFLVPSGCTRLVQNLSPPSNDLSAPGPLRTRSVTGRHNDQTPHGCALLKNCGNFLAFLQNSANAPPTRFFRSAIMFSRVFWTRARIVRLLAPPTRI